MPTFSQKIIALRQKHKLSQAEFGKSVQVTQGAVGNWEVNGNIPEMPTIIRICKKYKVAIGDLFSDYPLPDYELLKKENAQLKEQVRLLNELVAALRKPSHKKAA